VHREAKLSRPFPTGRKAVRGICHFGARGGWFANRPYKPKGNPCLYGMGREALTVRLASESN